MDAFFHIIDHATKYSQANLIPGKRKDIIIDKLFQHWTEVFGCPQRFLSNNGGEFKNELFRNASVLLNVEVATTAAESHWSNRIAERHMS